MKTVKSSLLLLALFFGLTTFTYPQFRPEPENCTFENMEGTWLETFASRGHGDVIWKFNNNNGQESASVVCESTAVNCPGVYPLNIYPFIYREGAVDPELIVISWMRPGGLGYLSSYECRRFQNSMTMSIRDTFPDLPPRPPRLLEFINTQALPGNGFASVPTLSEWGLIAMAGVLGIVGFMVIRRKKVIS